MDKKKTKYCWIVGVFIIIACVIFYIFFLRGYMEQKKIIEEYNTLKEQTETRMKTFTVYADKIQTISNTTEINTTATTFFLLYEEQIKDFGRIEEILFTRQTLLEKKNINPEQEQDWKSEKEVEMEKNKERIEIEQKIVEILLEIETKKQEEVIITKGMEQYKETEETTEILTSLYKQKQGIIFEIETHLKILEEFLNQNQEKRVKDGTESLLAWIKEQEKENEGGKDIIEQKIAELTTPLYKVLIIPTYEEEIMFGLLDQMETLGIPILKFEITNNRDTPVTLVVSGELSGYTQIATETVTIPARNTETIPLYFYSKSKELSEKKSVQLKYSVDLLENKEQKTVLTESKEVSLFPKNVIVLNPETYPESILVAFVTPHTDEIKEMLRKAAEYHPYSAMSNLCSWCQSSNDWRIAMMMNIKALFEALKYEYDITYVNTPIAYGTSNEIWYQTIYSPSQVMQFSSANCLDGTIIFASALEAIGIDAYIALQPGHSFVCYDLSPQDSHDNIEQCLETTMINDWGYLDAIEVGNDEATRDGAHYISVKEARKEGILPIE